VVEPPNSPRGGGEEGVEPPQMVVGWFSHPINFGKKKKIERVVELPLGHLGGCRTIPKWLIDSKYNLVKNAFYPLMFHLFFNLASKVFFFFLKKKNAMCPNQVLKNFKVANLLLESVFLTEIDPCAS
jgi:hypothetical protein